MKTFRSTLAAPLYVIALLAYCVLLVVAFAASIVEGKQ